MTFFESFYQYVNADAGFTALVTKVVPNRLPQVTAAQPLPDVCMTVKLVTGASEPPTMQGASAWHTKRVQVTVWSKSFKSSEKAIAYTRTLFQSFNGYLGGTPNVRMSVNRFAGPRSVYDDATRMDGVQLDIIGLVDESTIS